MAVSYGAFYFMYSIPPLCVLVFLPISFLIFLLFMSPWIYCMKRHERSCCIHWIKKLVIITTKIAFSFLRVKKEKSSNPDQVPRFAMFGYYAPKNFIYYLFFLLYIIVSYAVVAFYKDYFIEKTSECSPTNGNLQCFYHTVSVEKIYKSNLTFVYENKVYTYLYYDNSDTPLYDEVADCGQIPDLECFELGFHIVNGIETALLMLAVAGMVTTLAIWTVLKLSKGNKTGCVPCPPNSNFICHQRCVFTILFQVIMVVVPRLLVLTIVIWRLYRNFQMSNNFSKTIRVLNTPNYIETFHLTNEDFVLFLAADLFTYGAMTPWCYFKKLSKKEKKDLISVHPLDDVQSINVE